MPAPTVEDILRQTGLSDEQIRALDAKVVAGFNGVLTEASRTHEAAAMANAEAKEAERRYTHMYQTEIVPALNNWGSEKATLTAERDFYKSQNEGARSAGFIPKDAPAAAATNADAQRGADGRYVAGGNPVPGSPAISDFIRATSNAQWAVNEYSRLYGNALPEDYDFEKVLSEAASNRMDFRDYVSRKYKFDDRRKEITERKQKEHDDAIRKDERAKADKDYAERGGSNPNLRSASSSQYSSVRKAVESGKAKDPLMMSADARRQQTRQMIQGDIAERESAGNA